MRLPHNAERHPIHRGEYIAYDADGYAFRVRHPTSGNSWVVYPTHYGRADDGRIFGAKTIARIAEKLRQSHWR